MTDARPAAPAPAAPPAWGRLFVGCAIAGGLLVLAGVTAFTLGMYWLLGSGRQAPTGAVVGPRSAGFIRISDLAADPGARALLGEVMARAQSAPTGGPQLPRWLRDMQAAQARQGISQWLPREATLSFEPQGDEPFGMSAAVNPRGMVQPFRLALLPALSREKGATVSRHGRHELLAFQKSGALCFMDGTIVWAPDAASLRAALDRLEPAIRNGAPVPDPAHTLPGQWDVSGWLGERLADTTVRALLAEPGEAVATALGLAEDQPEGPFGLRDLRFGLDVRSKSDADVTLDVAFASAGEAAAAEPALTAALRRRIEQEPGLTATLTPQVEDDHVRYQVAFRDLDQMIARRMAERPGFERR